MTDIDLNVYPPDVEPNDTEPYIPSDSDYEANLAAATEELNNMTPQAYMELKEYLESIESQLKIPEAGGVAWTTVYGANGGVVNLTARAETVEAAIRDLMKGVAFLMTNYPKGKWTPYRPHAPQAIQPQPQQPSATPAPVQTSRQQAPPPPPTPQQPSTTQTSEMQVIDVVSVSHAIARNGADYIAVKGGMYQKFGVPAYDEIVPEHINYKSWPVNREYAPPPELAKARVDVAKRKVIEFLPQEA